MIRGIMACIVGFVVSGCAFSNTAKLGVLVLDDMTGMPMEGVRVRGGFTVNAGWEAVKGSPLPKRLVVSGISTSRRIWSPGRTAP